MALAQHHGLPTRLLDWSTRSYVAAYFAISDALAKKPQPDRLEVWVLNITQSFTHSTNLKTVQVPDGNNPNLAAQADVFTLLQQKGRPFDWETSLDGHFLAQKSLIPIPMQKITLPVTEAPAALRLCEIYGVTGATLFPDYYGAARAAKDVMQTAWQVAE